METRFLQIVTCIFSLVVCACQSGVKNDALSLYNELDKSSPANTLTDAEKKNGWKLLFDGSNTEGWRGYNMDLFPDCWKIEEGCLTMTTEGGAESQDIITDKSYRNFAFSVEFKLSTGANSGIIYQIAEDPKYKFPYETGPEVQIIDDAGYPGKLEDWQTCGANYAMYPASKKNAKPVGEWNHILLVVSGNKVTQVMNGEVIVEFEKHSEEWTKLRNSGKWSQFPDYGKYDEGHISLQNHGSKVWFRNVKLKEL
jgi:hypothetical protein